MTRKSTTVRKIRRCASCGDAEGPFVAALHYSTPCYICYECADGYGIEIPG